MSNASTEKQVSTARNQTQAIGTAKSDPNFSCVSPSCVEDSAYIPIRSGFPERSEPNCGSFPLSISLCVQRSAQPPRCDILAHRQAFSAFHLSAQPPRCDILADRQATSAFLFMPNRQDTTSWLTDRRPAGGELILSHGSVKLLGGCWAMTPSLRHRTRARDVVVTDVSEKIIHLSPRLLSSAPPTCVIVPPWQLPE